MMESDNNHYILFFSVFFVLENLGHDSIFKA